jgi:hypothetical protein
LRAEIFYSHLSYSVCWFDKMLLTSFMKRIIKIELMYKSNANHVVTVDPSGACLRLIACWDCGFESGGGHGWLSVISVVCVVR